MAAALRAQDLAGATRLLVMQASPFCNIACDYCYLPDRDLRHRISLDTVTAGVAWLHRHGLAPPLLSLVWHAGEPLALPVPWFRQALSAAEAGLPPGAALRHCVQTNAMPVTEAWCDLLAERGVHVGVSLDGPAELHDRHRRSRAGAGTHAAALRGTRMLRDRGLAPSAICVITAASLDRPEAIIEFFAAEGIRDLAFNVEEIEGVNRRSSLAVAGIEPRFRAFFERALDCALRHGIALREARDVLGLIHAPQESLPPGNDQNMPFANVTVAWDGSLHSFSPELAGVRHPGLGSTAIGHVARDTLESVLAGEAFRRLWRDIAEGVEACRRGCAYFPLCRGGAPSNKLAERGSLAATETLSCRLVQQQVAEVVLGRLLRGGLLDRAAPQVGRDPGPAGGPAPVTEEARA